MSELKITGVQCFLTQPTGIRLIVVKVLTSEPGLYGLGCATFTWRHKAVQAAIEHHIGPFAVGKDPRNIEDFWQSAMVNGYWRNGPVLNNAISGVDQALWDIKGKLAGMPCYQLWGGACRPAVPIYTYTSGRDEHEIADSIRRLLEEGYYHIRCQFSTSTGIDEARKPAGTPPGAYFEPRQTLHRLPKLFEHLRREIGEKVELMYDVHERFAPIDAVWLAKALEPYRLFFLEDLLAPEDLEWFANVRAVCATPLAMGELFNNPREITPLIAGRLIDFIRCHVSQLGGATPALKVAHLAAAFGVRTAWHGPVDVSPVGMAANVHLSMASHNCGLLEWAGPADRPDLEHEIFPGLPRVERGHVRPNDRPGWGIDFDEELAAKYPCVDEVPTWTVSRLPDGTIWRP